MILVLVRLSLLSPHALEAGHQRLGRWEPILAGLDPTHPLPAGPLGGPRDDCLLPAARAGGRTR